MWEIIRGTSIALLLRVLGALLGLGFNLLLSHKLGADGVGSYYLTLGLIMVASVFGRLGVETSLLRFTAAHASIGEWGAVKGAYQKGVILALAASGIAAVSVFLFAGQIAQYFFHNPELSVLFRLGSLVVIPFSLSLLHSEALKGLKKIVYAMLLQPQGIIVSSILIFWLFFWGGETGVEEVVLAFFTGTLITMVLGFTAWRKLTPQLIKVTAKFELRKLLNSSMPLFVMACMFLVLDWASTFFLEIFESRADVGVFNVAFRLAALMNFILAAVITVVAPKFAEQYKQSDLKGVHVSARNATKLSIIAASPLLIVFLLFPGFLMGLFGEEFVAGSNVLVILACGQFVNILTGPVTYLLMMSGNERYAMYNTVIAGSVSLILNLILIPRFGIIGAAIATAISLALINLLSFWQVKRRLGFSMF